MPGQRRATGPAICPIGRSGIALQQSRQAAARMADIKRNIGPVGRRADAQVGGDEGALGAVVATGQSDTTMMRCVQLSMVARNSSSSAITTRIRTCPHRP